MDSDQSFLLNDIKQHVKDGGNVTHILNVQMSQRLNSEKATCAKQAIYRFIQGIAITYTINSMNVTITWRASTDQTSAYHADVGGMYGDVAVKRHTNMLLQTLIHQLDPLFEFCFTQGITGIKTTEISLVVTRPLMRTVCLIDDDD